MILVNCSELVVIFASVVFVSISIFVIVVANAGALCPADHVMFQHFSTVLVNFTRSTKDGFEKLRNRARYNVVALVRIGPPQLVERLASV